MIAHDEPVALAATGIIRVIRGRSSSLRLNAGVESQTAPFERAVGGRGHPSAALARKEVRRRRREVNRERVIDATALELVE